MFLLKNRRYILPACLAPAVLYVIANVYVKAISAGYIFEQHAGLPRAFTVIVPGALVSQQGRLSNYLQDRMDAALELYHSGKVCRFLLSGDHGQTGYDEVNSMKHTCSHKGLIQQTFFWIMQALILTTQW